MQGEPITALLFSILLLLPLIMWGIAVGGGWRLLASHYQTDQQKPDSVLKWKSGTFAYRTSYGGLLHITGLEEGLYLSTNILFRFAHPPLLIPWEAIVSAEIAKYSRVWLTIATSQGDIKMLKVSLYGGGMAEHLTPFLKMHGLLSAE